MYDGRSFKSNSSFPDQGGMSKYWCSYAGYSRGKLAVTQRFQIQQLMGNDKLNSQPHWQNLRNPMIVDPSPMSFHSRFPQFTLDRRWAVEPPKRPSQNAWSCRWETQVIMICNKDSCYVSYSVSLFVASGIKDDKGLYSSILLLALLQARNSIDIQSIGWQAQQCRTCLLSNEGKIPPDVKWHLPLMMQKSRKC